MSAESPPESPLSFHDGRVDLRVDLRVYRLTAVQKAAYRLAERCTAALGAPDGETLQVALLFRPGTVEREAHETARLFLQELLDQELREKIAEETQPLRAFILAHAFSKTDLIRQ
jgi:His-Xaa-Ser system protein HxsD